MYLALYLAFRYLQYYFFQIETTPTLGSNGVPLGVMGINPESKCQFYPPDIPYKTKFLLLKESKECLLLFQESIKLTQELLAAVDEGELAAVVKLLKNPELSSVNVTNKVKREREREGEKEREREREREGGKEREMPPFFSLSPHSMERVLCT